MPFDPISYILAKKGITLPTLNGLVIDVDKDWEGHIIKNLGEPVDPNDAARKIYVDLMAAMFNITYYLLDSQDLDVPDYKEVSLTPVDTGISYTEKSSNTAGEVYVDGWISPHDATPSTIMAGTYVLVVQAERVSGNIDVRLFFRLYERQSDGTEVLIAESNRTNLFEEKAILTCSMILESDYTLQPDSRLVLKVYIEYASGGANTTVRVYYKGDTASRFVMPTTKEVLDTLYAPKLHAAQHALGGEDELSLDASQITSGVLSVDRIPDLSRSKITDFFSSPFWDNIPDKPFSTLGSEFTVSAGELQINSISRSKISDFFNSPFWDNIPDKPSYFPSKISMLTVDAGLDLGSYSLTANSILATGVYNTRDQSGNTTKFFSRAGTAPNTDFHFLADYVRPSTTATTRIIFGYNSEITRFQIYSKISGSNLELFRVEGDGSGILTRSIKPLSDNTYNLGDSSYRWKNGYFSGQLFIEGTSDVSAGTANTGVLFIGDPSGQHIAIDNNEIMSKSSGTSAGTLYLQAEGGEINIGAPIYPKNDNALDIGNSSSRWRNIHAVNVVYHDGTDIAAGMQGRSLLCGHDFKMARTANGDYSWKRALVPYPDTLVINYGGDFSNGVRFDSKIFPGSDNALDIGSSSLRWRNIYAVNVYTADIVLNNGWRVTEYDENGNKMEGVRILNAEGKEIFKITEDGLYFKGKKIA